ncbi:NAD(P)/FAD-dependent oxidoreductase [Agrobacterium vitis]|uniref:FAD-dependent oxidoreductase n=1 Tax=Agrobacterium vitis TaxID=373 RepID=A0AAE5AWZ9_AGRVI|nr:NAD(P)/FAD-dependent oxidoreductase [Agrobacterium vitis]MCM2442310.1 NAD(P)/FAD-dependent oxidoreductase [Agrobacterium vitis]MUZ58720.1 FAD-dependent oxidoreductase [Agrobacterium vitis]MVA66355.1 FAD-dependent oxidoreductase [Agrobacterium vitis]MVA88392.1 FAD-dependent oxidoreductase [Agrobacterium vitis]
MSDSSDRVFDVAIVGAGVAGTAAAILLAQAGKSVILLERKREVEDYKLLCTHFVQPFANAVFHSIGLGHLLAPPHSIETKATFYVPGGVIDLEEGYGEDPVTAYAHNLERRVLDPALRQRAIEAGVTLELCFDVAHLETLAGEQRIVGWRDGQQARVSARMVAAADGRQSLVASLMGATGKSLDNDRAAYFCYCKGIPSPANNRSLFVLHDNEMSFLYPIIEGRSLLSVYVTMERSAQWRSVGAIWPQLLERFKTELPMVDFSSAEPDTEVYSYRKYDNQIRPAVTGGVAFLGDAAVSIDPMSGVGCSFALKSADLFAKAVLDHTCDSHSVLAKYAASHASFFEPHITGIVADSRVSKSTATVEKTYATILRSKALQKQYLDLTARLISPEVFQRAYLREAIKGNAAPMKPAVVAKSEIRLPTVGTG